MKFEPIKPAPPVTRMRSRIRYMGQEESPIPILIGIVPAREIVHLHLDDTQSASRVCIPAITAPAPPLTLGITFVAGNRCPRFRGIRQYGCQGCRPRLDLHQFACHITPGIGLPRRPAKHTVISFFDRARDLRPAVLLLYSRSRPSR